MCLQLIATSRNSAGRLTLMTIILGLAGCQGEPAKTIPSSVELKPVIAERQSSNARLPFELENPPVARSRQPTDWFEDVTVASGVNFRYRTGVEARYYTILEVVGGGVALFDYDRDGDLDIFLAGGGRIGAPAVTVSGVSSALYRNDGNCKFTDVTASMGLNQEDLYTHGATVGDYNRDGFPDLFVTGYGGCRLFRNKSGQRFVETPLLEGNIKSRWFTSAAWGDFDRDGWLDLMAVCYADWNRTEDKCFQRMMQGPRRDACAPTQYKGQQSFLWRNLADGTFANVSDAAGILPGMRSLGTVSADLDRDGWLDWFVANDVHDNQLYWGGGQLPFDEGGMIAGVACSEIGERDGSMGTDIADFDGDGELDLFIANYAGQDNMLMRGTGSRGFVNVTRATGLAAPSRRWVKFGSLFADFDLDGWLDLFIANGHVLYDAPDTPYFQPAQLFKNELGQKFTDVSESAAPYFSTLHAGRGAAVGDLDNDGAPDLIVVHQDQAVQILRNRHQAKHWIGVSLQGRASGMNPTGAIASLEQDGHKVIRVVNGGGSYLSHSDLRILFVTKNAEPVDVTVTWLGGQQEVFSGLSTRSTHELVEGTGRRP